MGALAGKVAIITGAARGQGAAHARRFADEGARVVLTDVRTDLGETLAKDIGEAARFVAHEVGDEAGWNAVIGIAESAFGGVDILVNNAGIVTFASVTDTDAAELERVLRINAMGAIAGMRLVVPAMRRRGGGSIVNVSSIAGLRGVRGMFAYSVSKWALRGASRSAAQDLAPEKIRVNVVMPGLIETPMTAETASPEALRRARDNVPLGRAGLADEVANAVLFLASDASAFVTGTELVIDGGSSA